MKLYKFENILNEIASVFDIDQWNEQVDLFTNVIKKQLDYFIYLNSYPSPLRILGGISHRKFYGKNNIYVNEKHVELDDEGNVYLGQEFANMDKIYVIIKDLDKTIATHATQADPNNVQEWGCCAMFIDCKELYSVPWFDTSEVTNMQSMFFCCKSLVSVPLFDTSKATNMRGMFYGCRSLSEKTIQEWSSVYNFRTDEIK